MLKIRFGKSINSKELSETHEPNHQHCERSMLHWARILHMKEHFYPLGRSTLLV